MHGVRRKMNFETSENKLRKIARERAKAKLGFYIHLVVYVCVNALLFTIWYLFTSESGGVPWFIFPLIGWGIGLIAHAVVTFSGISTESLEDRMTEQELAKLKEQQSK